MNDEMIVAIVPNPEEQGPTGHPGPNGILGRRIYEMVNHPRHYQSNNGVECIDAINAATEGLTGIEAFDTGSAIKYLWRWKKKENPVQDIKKAIWYLNNLIENIEESNKKEI